MIEFDTFIDFSFQHHGSKVPLRSSSVNDLGHKYYGSPARFHGKLTLAVAPDWHLSCDSSKAKPVSPAENTIAFLLPLSPI